MHHIPTTARPGWTLIGYAYQDETQSGGNHNVYIVVLDQNGAPLSGIVVWLKWPGALSNESQQATITGATNFGLYGGPFYPDQGQNGAYSVYVEDKAKSSVVLGMGLPVNRHVNYFLTFQRVLVTPPPPPGDYVTQAQFSALADRVAELEAWRERIKNAT